MNSSEKTAEVRTRQENLKLLVWQYENNRSITSSWHETFLVLYILIGIVAVFANGLVVIAVFRNKKVREQIMSKFNLQKGDLIRLRQLLFLLFFQISLIIYFHLRLILATEKENSQSKPYIEINEQSNQQEQKQ